jgi:hypothetical protein
MSEMPNAEYGLTAKQLRDLADIVEAFDNKARSAVCEINLSGDLECRVTVAYDGTGTFGVIDIEGIGDE